MTTPIDMSDASDAVIAVLGGMGSYSTLHFFEELLRAFPAEKEWQRPRIVIDNNCVLPSRVRAVLYDERRNELVSGMAASITWLMQVDPDCIAIPCNTAHLFLPEVAQQADTSRVVDMIDVTLEHCAARQLRRVGL
ncbi:MAG: aspartate/glutamate racemase family protein, partial [Candidatus Dadabacteria bacterium]